MIMGELDPSRIGKTYGIPIQLLHCVLVALLE